MILSSLFLVNFAKRNQIFSYFLFNQKGVKTVFLLHLFTHFLYPFLYFVPSIYVLFMYMVIF